MKPLFFCGVNITTKNVRQESGIFLVAWSVQELQLEPKKRMWDGAEFTIKPCINLSLNFLQSHYQNNSVLPSHTGAQVVNRSLKSSKYHEKDVEDFLYLSGKTYCLRF